MHRRALVAGAVAVALSEITGVAARKRNRHRPRLTAEGMTWKGNIPLWDVDGEQVDVTFGWDDAYFKSGGRITATITVPNGMTATLVQDITPTDWTIAHSANSAITVTASFPCVNTIARRCSGGVSGIQIHSLSNTSPHGWDPVTVLGSYNAAYSATTA